MAVVPSVSMPAPSEVRVINAEPDLSPSLAVLSVTDRLSELVTCAARPVNEPAAEIDPVAEPMVASSASEKPSAAAVLVSVNACDTAALTWTLPKLTGLGVAVDAAARRYTVPVAVIVCALSAVVPRPSMLVPSEISEITADPDLMPTVPVFNVTLRLLLSVDWAVSPVNDPATEIDPAAEPMLASSASEKPSFGSVLVNVNASDTASLT